MYWLNVQVICAGVPPLNTLKLGTVPQYRRLKGATIAISCIVLDSKEHTYMYREAKIDVWVHINTHVTLTCGGPMQSGLWIVLLYIEHIEGAHVLAQCARIKG